MVEYSHAIDAQISEELRRSGRVSPGSIPGLSEEQGAAFLRRYLKIHQAEVPLRLEEGHLTYDTPAPSQPQVTSGGSAVSTGPAAASQRPSPVDQVLSQPVGRSLLDAAPSGGRVSGALWLLPFSLGAVGGLIAWALARETNERVARQMLIVGVVLTVVGFCLGAAMAPMLGSLSSQLPSPSSTGPAWPASTTGRPVFYYFGTST